MNIKSFKQFLTESDNVTVKLMKGGKIEVRDSNGKVLITGTNMEVHAYIKSNNLTAKFLPYDPFDESLTEAESPKPVCVGTNRSSIIIVFPGSNVRYHFDLGLAEEAEKYRRLCAKYGAGKYIKKFKQYPTKTVRPQGEEE
jgi:hypothetical protein